MDSEQRERQLNTLLARLRERTGPAGASPEVAARVLTAHAERRPRAGFLRPLLALAASLLVVAAGLLLLRQAGRPPAAAPDRTAAGALSYAEFFPLSAAGFDPAETSHVIRIRLPRGELRRFGLPVGEGLAQAAIEADVVIGQDGMARAVRFVQ